MALDLKNLSIRTVSGLVYAGLLVGAIVLGPLATAILSAVLAAGASFELCRNTVGRDNPGRWTMTWFIDASSLVLLILGSVSYASLPMRLCLVLFVVLIFVRFFVQIFINQRNPLRSIAIYTFELFYIGIPLCLLVLTVCSVFNPWIVICAIAMIWISDTGAYLVGSLFGKHRLFPSLSPKKSWEGFLGGLAFNIGVSFIYFYVFRLNELEFLSNVQGWIYIGICVTAFATLGDLFESMLKRSLGIKDFSHLIPGHGGVLDRIDSLLCVIPCVLVAIALGARMFGV